MKLSLTKFLLPTIALAFAIPAFAGPMPAEKNMAPVAPAPECTWTGFYVGLNAGVGQLDSTFTDRDDWEEYATREFSETAFVGGGQLGYNYQWQDLVFGIEADISGSTADIYREAHYYEGDAEYGHRTEGFDDKASIDLLGSIRGRLGVSFNNNRALLYATAGGAYAHGEWDVYYHYDYGYTPTNYYEAGWRGDDWRWGWVGGFGFEYMLNCHWSVRGEGLYYWFGEDTTGVNEGGAYYAPGGDGGYGNFWHYTFGDTLWTYRVGVNYKFGSFFGH